jgi:hypothetical protein
MNPDSNCFVWRTLLLQAYESSINDIDQIQSIQAQVDKLDSGIEQWCNSQQGQQSNECACVGFPFSQKAQCTAQNAQCGGIETQNKDCYGRYFTRQSDGCSGDQTSCCFDKTNVHPIPCVGTYLEITLQRCVPYFCWVAECTQPASQLLTSNVIASTQNGACSAGICVNVQGTNVISIQEAAFIPNKDSTNYTPGYNILGSCGVDIFANPNLLPTFLILPVDQVGNYSIAVTNSGSQFLEMYLETSANQPSLSENVTQPFAIAPAVISVGARSVTIVTIKFDIQVLYTYWLRAYDGGKYPKVGFDINQTDAANGFLPGLNWSYSYTPIAGTPQLFPITVGNIKLPITELFLTRPADAPLPPTPIPVTPWYSYTVLFVTGSFFILMVLRTIFTDRNIVRIRNRALKDLQGMTSYYYS